jgi:hypothetical protein
MGSMRFMRVSSIEAEEEVDVVELMLPEEEGLRWLLVIVKRVGSCML